MSNKLVIGTFLESEPPLGQFRSSNWPIHMTLLPPFICDKPLDIITAELERVAEDCNPFAVRTAGIAPFMAEGDMPVSLVQEDEQLTDLYTNLGQLAGLLGFTYEYEPHKPTYSFHIAHTAEAIPPEDREIKVASFSLVDRRHNDVPKIKKVLSTHYLGQPIQ